MRSPLAWLVPLVASVLIAGGCGGDDGDADGGTRRSDGPTTAATTERRSRTDFDAASKDLCDVLGDQPEIAPTSANSPEGAVDAAGDQVRYYERAVRAIDQLPEPDEADEARALRRLEALYRALLRASRDTLEITETAVEDPAAATREAGRLARAARTIAERSTELAEVSEDLDLEGC